MSDRNVYVPLSEILLAGGSESGNSSCDTNASGSTTSQTGGDQVARSSTSTVSGSSIAVSHPTPGANTVTEVVNSGRSGTSVSAPTTGLTSAREPLVSSSSTPVTMNITSAATLMPNNSIITSAGDNIQPSKSAATSTIAPGTSSSGLNSGTTGTTTTSSLPACAPSSSAATSSSYTDYRQIKRKLRSQVDDNVSPSVGSNGQQGTFSLQTFHHQYICL